MIVLKANLKHLYQPRGLWLYYFLLAFFVYQMFQFHPRNAHLIWMWYVLINLMAGLALGMLQREILSKPFTYCLPGHRPIPRRIIGSAGMVLNAGLSFVFLVHPQITTSEAPIIMAMAFSVGLAVYLLAARSMFTLSERVVPYMAGQLAFMWLIYAKGRAVDSLILAWPEFVMTFALAVSVGLWMNLRRGIDARRFCGQAVQSLGDLSRATIERNQWVRRVARADSLRVPSRVEAVFLDRIDASLPLSAARCVWADLYVAFAPLISWGKWVILLCVPAVLVLALVAGKLEGGPSMRFPALRGVILFQIVAFASLVPTFQIPIPVFSSMLLTRGRRQRFGAMMFIALVLASFVSSLLILVTLCTAFLQFIAPGLFGSFMHLSGGPLIAAFVVAPFGLVPLGLTVRLLVKYLGAAIYAMAGVFVFVTLTVRYGSEWIGMPLFLAALACSWPAFILATHRICTSRSLAQ